MARSNDCSIIDEVVTPIPYEKLVKTLLAPDFYLGPRAVGRVELIVLRPEINLREVVSEAVVDVEYGMHGSGWVKREERGLIDQVCVMSAAAIREIAGKDKMNWSPAGDNLFVNMDLSVKNLPEGTRVRIGNVEAVVSPKPHHGNMKFSKRYGMDALKALNSPVGKERRLRGVYFSVTKPGIVKVGDPIVRIEEPRPTPTVKRAEGLELVVEPVPFEVLAKKMLSPDAPRGPADAGRVDLIVLRPGVNGREIVTEGELSPENGLLGSGWVEDEVRKKTNQICVMPSLAIRAIAGDDKRDWQAAGDNLFVDMDFSKTNMPVGTRVRLGTAEGVVTTKPHKGCPKFSKRYGLGALRLVNSPVAKEERLRGIYFEVVKAGVIREGDMVVKMN